MIKKFLNFTSLILVFLNYSAYAEVAIDESVDLYQVKLIMVAHNSSNNIDFHPNFISDNYIEKDFIEVSKNNCIISDEKTCIKYDFDYKVETFNDFKSALESDKDIEISKNNCIISDEKTCIKYDFDYKVETFNDFKSALESDKDIEIISHLEWIQNLSSNYKIKIKDGYDYSNDLINGDIEVNDIEILGSGRITKYEGSLLITKNKFFNVSIDMFERKIMAQPGFFSTDFLVSKKYNISQKIQLKKVTYIDREYYGIIIKIIRITD